MIEVQVALAKPHLLGQTDVLPIIVHGKLFCQLVGKEALGLVKTKETAVSEALLNRGNFVGQVEGILYPSVHAKATAWWESVRCITSQEDLRLTLAVLHLVRYHSLHHPGVDIHYVKLDARQTSFFLRRKEGPLHHGSALFGSEVRLKVLNLGIPWYLEHKFSSLDVVTD